MREMSVILNSVYGHAILEYLLPMDIIMLYRVDTDTRAFLTSSDVIRDNTFEQWVCGRASEEYNIKGRLLIYMQLDMTDEFKDTVKELDSENEYRRTDDALQIMAHKKTPIK